MNVTLFLAGLICGGCFSVVFLFGLQISRMRKYEDDLRHLHEKSKSK